MVQISVGFFVSSFVAERDPSYFSKQFGSLFKDVPDDRILTDRKYAAHLLSVIVCGTSLVTDYIMLQRIPFCKQKQFAFHELLRRLSPSMWADSLHILHDLFPADLSVCSPWSAPGGSVCMFYMVCFRRIRLYGLLPEDLSVCSASDEQPAYRKNCPQLPLKQQPEEPSPTSGPRRPLSSCRSP